VKSISLWSSGPGGVCLFVCLFVCSATPADASIFKLLGRVSRRSGDVAICPRGDRDPYAPPGTSRKTSTCKKPQQRRQIHVRSVHDLPLLAQTQLGDVTGGKRRRLLIFSFLSCFKENIKGNFIIRFVSWSFPPVRRVLPSPRRPRSCAARSHSPSPRTLCLATLPTCSPS